MNLTNVHKCFRSYFSLGFYQTKNAGVTPDIEVNTRPKKILNHVIKYQTNVYDKVGEECPFTTIKSPKSQFMVTFTWFEVLVIIKTTNGKV